MKVHLQQEVRRPSAAAPPRLSGSMRGVAPTAHPPRPREPPRSFTDADRAHAAESRPAVRAVARREAAAWHLREDRVVDDLARARTELDRRAPTCPR